MSVKTRIFITIATALGLEIVFGIILLTGACSPKSDELATFMSLDCTSCHGSTPDFPVKGDTVFNKLAAAVYNNDGKVEPLQLEVKGLLSVLVNEKGSGLLQRVPQPLYDARGNRVVVKTGTKSAKEIAAVYNYTFFVEDRSLGIHNASYTIQVLYDTIESLNPSFDVSKRPI
ncbi:MAG: hypothetical protein JW904_07190 [Spirochaetales bacterium]|nr:hypothetical protein [Spirochaetales bacterium]